MRRWLWYLVPLCLVAALAAGWGYRRLRAEGPPAVWEAVPRAPRIRPDYTDTVLPPNIAPLNFAIEEPGSAYRVRVHAARGAGIEIASAGPTIEIPLQPWKALLDENRGGRLEIDVYAQGPLGQWNRFQTIANRIADEPIDSHLVYRLLGAVFTNWGHLGIYQRNLETFEETPILRNTAFKGGCVNCHSFPAGRPEHFSLHVRPPGSRPFEGGMLAVHDGQAARIATKSAALPRLPTYTSWHPTAPLAATSLTRAEQFLHGAGVEVREVYDLESDLAVIDVRTGAISSPPALADPGRLETFPGWSADGRYLYFCSAPQPQRAPTQPPNAGYESVRHDLMRIRYDVERGTWGPLESVLTAAKTGRSINEPRVSPDGRWLLFCMTDRGAFPVLRADSDLYLMNLAKGAEFPYRPLTRANSTESDSWHCWSSNSRWIVFSSKRGTGLFARPQICYVDSEGREHKPFVLPQQDPRFYDSYLKTYNVPELVRGPVRVAEESLVQAILAAPGGEASQTLPPSGVP